MSTKPGVLSTIAIDRASRSLISMEGTVSSLLLQSQFPLAPAVALPHTQSTAAGNVQSSDSVTGSAAEEEKTNEFVQMMWKYVYDTEHMMQAMDNEVRRSFSTLR